MKLLITSIFGLFLFGQINAQCITQKTGKTYGFFRATNFISNVCWMSEPFAYTEKDGMPVNFEKAKQCFKDKVVALGGNVESALDEFGKNRVRWLNNHYNPDSQGDANWGLPSKSDCIVQMKNEVQYKTGIGLQVKIVKMYTNGTIDATSL